MVSILTTHFLKDIEIFCDKITIIKEGKLMYYDELEKLRNYIGGYNLTLYVEEITEEKESELKKRFVKEEFFLESINESLKIRKNYQI